MNSVRLLPVVIVAALALLLFKGMGLVMSGGYVFVGTTTALAAGAPAAPAAASHGTPTIALPAEHTMTDTAPTIDDGAPTLAAKDEGYGAPAAHGEEPAADEADGEEPVTEELAHGEAAADAAHGAPAEAEHAEDPRAEGVPMMQTGTQLQELVSSGTLTEQAVLERLRERRAQLDARETELAMRMSLVEAAELRLQERAAALAVLEERINSLVDEQKAIEDGQFASIVGMYETMKPGEAAAIFNELDMHVLVRVARAMNPRKMAPILAKMSAERATALTVTMAAGEGEPQVDMSTGTDLASLPQIVGQ